MSRNHVRCLLTGVFLVVALLTQATAADVLSGRVYEGNTGTEPPQSTALVGVTVKLYGSNNSSNLGSQIGSTTTDSQGWYGLTATAGYEYYTIIETDPSGYYSVGASSVSGTVVNSNRIRYSVESAPLADQTLTGNKFWDKPTQTNRPPVADANGPYNGTVGQPITLDASGSYDPDAGDSIVSYEWDLDLDGQYDDATGVSPSWTWHAPTVTLAEVKVTDTHGAWDTDSTLVTITAAPPDCRAGFSADPTQGCAPLQVQFEDKSTGAQSWEWTFPGGTPGTSTLQHPAVTYQTPGSYGVILKIWCVTGAVDSVYYTDLITVDDCSGGCQAAFNADPTEGCAPLQVQFTDQSSGAQSWEWTFPGGTPGTSTQQHPAITYNTPGVYPASLTIRCASENDSSVYWINDITVEDCSGGELDFGDAPDDPQSPGYPTLLVNNGARHAISSYRYLGNSVDPEPDGQPVATADGDDLNPPGAPDDEDGVIMWPFIAPGQTVPIAIAVRDTCVLNAWLDFNVDGDWDDSGEHFIVAQQMQPVGFNLFTLNVPFNATLGATYARFRVSSIPQLSYDGFAPDGEVEDYRIEIVAPEEGSVIIIKEANPKDNTTFWFCQQLSGFFNIFCAPLQDPLNNKLTILNPSHVQNVTESGIPGWSLKNITVTGDMDNGSTIDLINRQVDLDFDPGENIVITFFNEKTGEDELYDLGDAPDGTNHSGLMMNAYPGVPARFPTVFDPATGMPPGPRHMYPKADAWLGADVSGELDADLLPDNDGLTNLDPPNDAPDRDNFDDGVNVPLALPTCMQRWFTYQVTVPPGTAGQDRYVNVWFDWNRDGDWADAFTCAAPNDAPEWAVQNQLIPGGFPPGTYIFATPLFRAYHPAGQENAPLWMRITMGEMTAPPDYAGGGSPNGYQFGETEDYLITPQPTDELEYDYGDAPLPYPTRFQGPPVNNDGGRHQIVQGVHLGAKVDPEPDGQPDPNAMGDDGDGNDDEDGVTLATPLIPGQLATFNVTASVDGYLNGYIDLDQDQNWTGPQEHIFIDVPVAAGLNPMSFTLPAATLSGATFARFRFSTHKLVIIPPQTFGSLALDGEVEDYAVNIEEGGELMPIKWKQPPLMIDDPEYPFAPCFRGWDEYSVYREQVAADDWLCKDPRPVTDIHWWGSYVGWDSLRPPEQAPYGFHIGIWTDVPAEVDQPWSHPGELVWEWLVSRDQLNERAVGTDFFPGRMTKPDTCFKYDFIIPPSEWFYQEGDSTIYWLSIGALYEVVPDTFIWGWKTREHYFHDDAVLILEPKEFSVGEPMHYAEPIAEMWDLAFVLTTDEYSMEFDYGDAPVPPYPTIFADNGAHHILTPGVFLGADVDAEFDGQPDANARGDDNDGFNDDDGIKFLTKLQPGNTVDVEVTASIDGFLNAWMDFNSDGNWLDPDEQIFKAEPVARGANVLSFTVPASTVAQPTIARFRFSTEARLPFIGLAIDGEVEDYYVDVYPVAVDEQSASLPDQFRLMQNFPNPFNPSTQICYEIPRPVPVRLVVYNLAGQEIAILVNESKQPGTHVAAWDGTDNLGEPVAGGIYIYRMVAGDFQDTGKLLFLK